MYGQKVGVIMSDNVILSGISVKYRIERIQEKALKAVYNTSNLTYIMSYFVELNFLRYTTDDSRTLQYSCIT